MKPCCSHPLPVEVVFHPSWWNRHAGIVFDEDFFYDPRRRVADEQRMERSLSVSCFNIPRELQS